MPKNSAATAILARLAKPWVASDLYDDLQAEGFSKTNLKSTVSRLTGSRKITRAQLTLGRGNTILFSGKPSPSSQLLKQLLDRDFYGRRPLGSLVRCLHSSHPAVTRLDVAKLAALEVGRPGMPDWTETDSVICGLVELGMLRPAPIGGRTAVWEGNKALFQDAGFPFSRTNLNSSFLGVRERVRIDLAASLADWLEKNSFAGAKTAQYGSVNSPGVNFLGLPFDVLAFTFLSGIVLREGKSQGRPIVGDVLIDTCNLSYAQSFIHRVSQCASKQKNWPIHFVLAKNFDRDAFDYLRHQGALVWQQAQLMGKSTAEALEKTLVIVESLVRKQNLNPALFALVFEGLENFESLFGNLKGKLFEILIGFVFQKIGYDTLLSWQVSDRNAEYDLDIVGRRGTEMVLIECKGLGEHALVSDKDVKRHFTERTPLARLKALEDPVRKPTRFRSIIATTGEFTDSTMAAVKSGSYSHKPDTTLELWDRDRLLSEIRSADLPDLLGVVRKYFSTP